MSSEMAAQQILVDGLFKPPPLKLKFLDARRLNFVSLGDSESGDVPSLTRW